MKGILLSIFIYSQIPDILKADLMDTLLGIYNLVFIFMYANICNPIPCFSTYVPIPSLFFFFFNSIDESDIPEDNVETSCKESTPADELSLVVTIPVHIKNGHIHAQETTTQEATLPEVIVIDDEIEHPVVSEDVVSGACSKSHSEQQVTVSEYASEEIALTSLPQSTADQVNETVSHLLSAALKTSDAIQTKSEIETLLSSISKSSVHQTVLLDSTVFDKEEQEYVHFDYYDIQSILSPKGCEDENTNEVCSDEPHVVDVSSEDGPAVVVDVSDIACEVVVSDNDEPDSVCESEDLASVLMANAFHIHSDEPSVQKVSDQRSCCFGRLKLLTCSLCADN